MRMEFSDDDGFLYDVVAVSLDDSKIIWIEQNKTLPNAEAIEAMAVMRQGVEERFFTHVPHGTYQQGDKYEGRTKQR